MALDDLNFLPTVRKCCCALELRLGSLMFAMAQVVFGTFYVVINAGHYDCVRGSCPSHILHLAEFLVALFFVVSAVFVILAFIKDTMKRFLYTVVIVQMFVFVFFLVMMVAQFVLYLKHQVINRAIGGLLVALFMEALLSYTIIVYNSWRRYISASITGE